MKRVVRLAALGVGAYVLILIVTFPATRISASLEDRVDDLAMNGVSGSLFSGQARQVVYQGLVKILAVTHTGQRIGDFELCQGILAATGALGITQ